LKNVPVLILANKQDIEGCLTDVQVIYFRIYFLSDVLFRFLKYLDLQILKIDSGAYSKPAVKVVKGLMMLSNGIL